MKFSIIVPVYNVELYLEDCLNSLLNQDFDDYEIILVNDGSTDGSQNICENYGKRYQKIKYYKKENGGLSDTRNYGLDRAIGEYIIFVDSDDWIKAGTLGKFNFALAKPKDVLVTRFIEAYPEYMKPKDEKFEAYLQQQFTNDRAVEWLMKKSENSWPAQKNIISKNFIDMNNLRFSVGRLHEDVEWTAKVCLYANSFQGFSDVWYYHRMERPGSITNSIKAKNIIDVIEMATSFFSEVQGDKTTRTLLIKERFMRTVYAKLNLVKECSPKERERVTETVKHNMELFKIAPEIRHLVFAKTMEVLGPKIAIALLAKL